MFERFTDQARKVVVLAQEEARLLGHSHIGTEHVLLGLLSEGHGVAAQALHALDIGLDAAREQVGEILGEGPGQHTGHIPFTPRAKKVLELSLREALRLGDDFIGTEHVLLGLVAEEDGVGAQVLVRLGASMTEVRAQVLKIARTAPAEGFRRVPATAMMAGRIPGEQIITRLSEVLNRLDGIGERLSAIESRLAGALHLRAEETHEGPAAGQPGPAPSDQPEAAAGEAATRGEPESPAGGEPPAAEA